MSRRVEGVYPTIDEAVAAVERLREEGYEASAITLVANAEVRSALPYAAGADVAPGTNDAEQEGEDHRSFWEKVKDALTTGNQPDASLRLDTGYEASLEDPGAYQDELEQGHVVILVEDADPAADHPQTLVNSAHDRADSGNSEDGILELREELLDIDLEQVQTGEIRISKRVVEDTETVEVPVTYDEITIERVPVTDRRVVDGPVEIIETEDEIVIPITEDRVTIDKETQVVEEVEIHKDRLVDRERVTETLRREELDVDTTGNAQVEENRTLSERREDQQDPGRHI